MTERPLNGFMLSAALHGLAAVLIFFAYVVGEQTVKNAPHVLELVQGEGDNYTATEAPALGTPGGIKVAIPDVPAAKPALPEPSPVQTAPEPVAERTPVTRAPTPTAKTEEPIRDFSKDVKRIMTKRAARLEAIDRKKREADERKAKEAELKQKRMTKAEFDAQNRAEAAAKTGGRAPKVSHIDAEGIRNGVIGGSAANKTGGAGGPALSREDSDDIDAYTALLARKIKDKLDERPGVGAGMVVEVEIHILADGTISRVRITKSSGSADFDDAAKDALTKIEMPARPAGLVEVQRFPIRGIADE